MVTVIDSFIYAKPDGRPDLDIGKTLNKSYQEDMRKMESLVRVLNRKNIPIRLTYYGNTKDGLKFIVDCSDEILKDRIIRDLQQFLNQWS
jgi:hypothetical protein